MSSLIGTRLVGRTKWVKTQGTGEDLISWAWWKWSVLWLIQDRAMRNWNIAQASNCSLQFLLKFNTSQQTSPCLCASLCLYSKQSHTHTHSKASSWKHIYALKKKTHTHIKHAQICTQRLTHLNTHTYTLRAYFFEWSMFSLQSSVFDTEPFCTCSGACAVDVEEKVGETHTYAHTHPTNTYIHWLWLA